MITCPLPLPTTSLEWPQKVATDKSYLRTLECVASAASLNP
jgi:hypothetical protein